MRNYSRITPEGTRDLLFKECRIQREAERKLAQLFSNRGYSEVLTPGLEYYDVFCLPDSGIPQQEMYKTTDNNGRLIVFRPDSTLPIARMAAARLQHAVLPIRLFYNQCVYRNRPDLSGKENEIYQMGVEMLGATGLRADIEVISMAVEALAKFTDDFRIEIGHAAIFKAFANRLPISSEKKEVIRATIEAKNYGALEEQLSSLGQVEAVEAIRSLPRLFGGEEALEKAKVFCTDEETEGILTYLRTLYEAITRLGYGDRVIVDLGLVQRNDYYSGVVFSAYAETAGEAVLVGGRYDMLLEKFDMPMPAVGFSIDTEAAVQMILSDVKYTGTKKERVIVHTETGFENLGQETVRAEIEAGKICELSVFDTLENSMAYAKQIGAKKIIHISEKICEIDALCGEEEI